MKFTVTKPTTIDVRYVRIAVPVEYDEEEIPNNFPCRVNDTWEVTVDIATGAITQWPRNNPASVHLTVKDAGVYSLIDAEGFVVGQIHQNYVPNGLIPGKWGDTIELEIDNNGIITNWPEQPCIAEFFKTQA